MVYFAILNDLKMHNKKVIPLFSYIIKSNLGIKILGKISFFKLIKKVPKYKNVAD